VRRPARALVEVGYAFQRRMREGSPGAAQARERMDLLRGHAEDGLWNLVPVTEALLRAAATLIRGVPKGVPLRAGDAIHLAAVLDAGGRRHLDQ
jgi:hypothetical protein